MTFSFNDTATTEIYTLSLHDALPIFGGAARGGGARCRVVGRAVVGGRAAVGARGRCRAGDAAAARRSEEHTSELQSRQYLVCRLLLEKNPTALAHALGEAPTHGTP